MGYEPLGLKQGEGTNLSTLGTSATTKLAEMTAIKAKGMIVLTIMMMIFL